MATGEYTSIYTGSQIDAAITKVGTVDASPTQNSTNFVTSGGVYTALTGKQNAFSTGNVIELSGGTLQIKKSDNTATQYLVSASSVAPQWRTLTVEVGDIDSSLAGGGNVDSGKVIMAAGHGDAYWGTVSGGGGGGHTYSGEDGISVNNTTDKIGIESNGIYASKIKSPTSGSGTYFLTATVNGTTTWSPYLAVTGIKSRTASSFSTGDITLRTINGNSIIGTTDLVIPAGTTYTPGDNITIVENVISATDTVYSASTGISISAGKAISNTGVLSIGGVNGDIVLGTNITISDHTLNVAGGSGSYSAGAGISISGSTIAIKGVSSTNSSRFLKVNPAGTDISWEDLLVEPSDIDSTGYTGNYILTVDGNGNAKWKQCNPDVWIIN